MGLPGPRTESIDLEPLAAEPAAALCRHLLAPVVNMPRDAVECMVERSQESPLLLEEVVRALRAAGAIRARSRGRDYYLATDALGGDLPVADWLVNGELGRIPPDLFLHACQAAVLGMEVSVEDAADLADELVGEGRAELVRSIPSEPCEAWPIAGSSSRAAIVTASQPAPPRCAAGQAARG